MTESSYPRLALLLHLLCLSAIHLVSSHALPANPQSPPSLPSLSLLYQNTVTITQNIQVLVNTLTADPNIEYSKSAMLWCDLAVEFYEHGDEPHDLYLSSNISHFRDIKCIFRYGGYIEDDRHSRFSVQNKFPQHWDQWSLPLPFIADIPTAPGNIYLPFAWSEVRSHMSAERADQLLKADGHEPEEQSNIGRYDMVTLRKRTANDLAWCFKNVMGDYPDTSGQHTYLVIVSTGKVEQIGHC